MAVSVSVLPTPSVTVRVTVTGVPMSVQSKAAMSKAYEAIKQSSVEPSLMPSAVTVASPDPSKYRVVSFVAATGLAESIHSSSSQMSLLFASARQSPPQTSKASRY